MKVSEFSKLKLLAAIFAIEALLATLVYFIAMPLLVPSSPHAANLRVALVVLLCGVIGSGLSALVLSRSLHIEKSSEEFLDCLRQPALVVDAENRYAILNQSVESTLGLDRSRDRGMPVDPRILAATGDEHPESLSPDAVLDLGGRQFQVIDNILPDRLLVRNGWRRMLVLRDVTSQVRVREAIREVNQSMAVLNANTIKIADSSVSLSQSATEQAASLAAITSSMNEFSQKIRGNSETAAQGIKLAAQAREAAEHSGQEIANALSAMTDVQDAGIRIARIVKLIDDIAFQTNLLALNAAVEAARAGRQGKGFAVVADEVRNLAGRSAKAAKDTAVMVEDVTERIGNASAYISRLEEMLRNIVQGAVRMADSSADSAATSGEQASGILQVNQELGQMNSVTHTTMEAAEQTATAVEALSNQVDALKRKLESLGAEYFQDRSLDRQGRLPPPAINLLDDPDPESAHIHSFMDNEDYSRLSSPLDDDDPLNSGGEEDLLWTIGDGEKRPSAPFGNPPRPDGFGKNNRNFMNKRNGDAHDASDDIFGPSFEDGLLVGPEGDRVISPKQRIQLDDAEFGRY